MCNMFRSSETSGEGGREEERKEGWEGGENGYCLHDTLVLVPDLHHCFLQCEDLVARLPKLYNRTGCQTASDSQSRHRVRHSLPSPGRSHGEYHHTACPRECAPPYLAVEGWLQRENKRRRMEERGKGRWEGWENRATNTHQTLQIFPGHTSIQLGSSLHGSPNWSTLLR